MLRKLARVTFNALTALSLLLCVAACVLWVRSYSARGDGWSRGNYRSASLSLSSYRGRLTACYFSDSFPGTFRAARGSPPYGWWHDHGFELTHTRWRVFRRPPSNEHFVYLTCPHWAPSLVAVLPPTAWLLAAVRGRCRRRVIAKLSLCPS